MEAKQSHFKNWKAILQTTCQNRANMLNMCCKCREYNKDDSNITMEHKCNKVTTMQLRLLVV